MMTELSLTLHESSDADDGTFRMDQSDMRLMGVLPNDVLALVGARTTYARVIPAFMEDRNQRIIRVSRVLQHNLGIKHGQKIKIMTERHIPYNAEQVTIKVSDDFDSLYLMSRIDHLSSFWRGRAIVAGDFLKVPTLDRHELTVKVASTSPNSLIQITNNTVFSVVTDGDYNNAASLGGVRDIYRTCFDIASARLKREREGVVSAKSVLLSGPAGCGKASLVSRLSQDMDVQLAVLDAKQLLNQRIEIGDGGLEISLSSLSRKGPAIVLIDNMEELTPHKDGASQLAIAQRTVLSQLFCLMDELPIYPNIIFFGIDSSQNCSLSKYDGHFDLILPIDAPDRLGRYEILTLATRNLPLEEDIDLHRLAESTAGTTARDLKQLVASASLLSLTAKISEEDFTAASRCISYSAHDEVRCDIPNVSWDDLVGLDEIKHMLYETLSWALLHNKRFASIGTKPSRAILLSGGRGTGKTTLARALAVYMPLNFIETSCPLLASLDLPEAKILIRDSFALARRKTPCMVFFDDIDALFDVDAKHNAIVAQISQELDRLNVSSGVVFIATTSRPDRISSDITRQGRLDFQVDLPLPDTAARKKMLQIHMSKVPLAADMDFDHLASITNNMSPAEIANICNRVGLLALKNSLNNKDSGVIPPVADAELFERTMRGRNN